MRLLPKSIHRCRRYPTKFNSGRDIPRTEVQILSSALLLRLSCCLRFHRVPRSELLAETAVACQGGGVAPSTRENEDWVF